MKQAPFYPNHEDNNRCMLAVYKSILDIFLNEKLDWDEIAEIAGYNNGKAAWTVQTLTYLSNRGIDIKMIEPFDYKKYYNLGETYLKTLFSDEELKWQLDKSNILQIKDLIPDFLKNVQYSCRSAQIDDIEQMLAEDRLVFVTLNSKILNDKPGYSNHAILIIDQTEDSFIFHDPGIPPVPYRQEKKVKVFKAMGGVDNHNEATGLKLSESKVEKL